MELLSETFRSLPFLSHIESVRHLLRPPVGNKLLFDACDLKVMVVGGPNRREDFHINNGEELFYQVQGSMVLKVVIEGSCRDIAIAEGELFLLPANVPHSPQRFENTVGLVLERTRASSEKDTLRWYMPGTYETILYQESFHCVDLGTQLKPVIERFFASEMYATKAPDQCYQAAQDLSIDASALKLPMNLAAISDRFENNCCSSILDSEFRVDIVKGVFDNNVQAKGSTVFLWQLRGGCEIKLLSGETYSLLEGHVAVLRLVKEDGIDESFLLKQHDSLGSVVVVCNSAQIL